MNNLKRAMWASTALVGGVLMATAASAQSTGSESFEADTVAEVVVTGQRGPSNVDGLAVEETVTRARSTLTGEYLESQQPGQSVLASIAILPGVTFSNSDAYGSSGGETGVNFAAPMDETLAQAALDLSGRAYFVFDGKFGRSEVGGLATELVPHFFRSLCDAAAMNLHLWVRGENTHHQVEACFKVVARALRQAIRREGSELPSTKGRL